MAEKQLIQVLSTPQPTGNAMDDIQENSKESKALERSKMVITEGSQKKERESESTLVHHKSVEQLAESLGIPVEPSPMDEPERDAKLDEMIRAYKMQLGIPVPDKEKLGINKVTSSAVYLNRKAHHIIDYTNFLGSNTESNRKMRLKHLQYQPFRAKKPKNSTKKG